jgi:hypothetical protein
MKLIYRQTKRIFVFLLLIILTSLKAYAGCDYPLTTTYKVPQLIISNGDNSVIAEYEKETNNFILSNPSSYQFVLKIYRIVNTTTKEMREVTFPIHANGKATLPGEFICINADCRLSVLKYSLEGNLSTKEIESNRESTSCKGLNNGEQCDSGASCGSGFCVERYCSNNESCYKNDCKCGESNVQCLDNKLCVKRNSVENDMKPVCNPFECKSNYYDEKAGKCAKSPDQIAKENEEKLNNLVKRIQTIVFTFVFAIAIVIAILLFGFKKMGNSQKDIEEMKQKTIKQEIEIIKDQNAILIKKRDELLELTELAKKNRRTKTKN